MKEKRICIIAMSLAILYCIGLVATACGTGQPTEAISASSKAESDPTGISMPYEQTLFDMGRVHTIDIQISESDWETLKQRAFYKEYYDCNAVVDGEAFYHVGVRTKGNVTLIQSAVREWDRYSLVLNFGAFDKSQRYYGLDKLSLNNNICDSSFIRDYLCYDMMASMGVPTPKISFVSVTLNGEPLGLYTAVENMAQSYAVRNFGYQYGNLYKPEQMDIAGMLTGKVKDGAIHVGELSGESGTVDAAAFLGVSDTTVGLQYQGDDASLYHALWDNAVFKIGTSDQDRLIDSIQQFNKGENLEDVLDTDELLRFFAVGAFVLNDDCYTSYAGHNYGLYEKDGKIAMLPWDYDHALGCTGAASGTTSWTEYINLPIDEPVINVAMAERPLINCLLTDEGYLAKYHAYLDQFLTEYVESGRLEATANQLLDLISPYVAEDTVSGVPMADFETAVASNLEFCRLRAQSIRGQLSGTIPSTKEGQAQAPETLVDCEHFVSPDSGSLIELLLPEGSGLYFEDFLRSIIIRMNPLATLSVLPVSDVTSLIGKELSEKTGGSAGESFVDRILASGRVQDREAFEDAFKLLALRVMQDLSAYLIAAVVLIAGFIFVVHYGKRRQPAARKGGKRYAV